MSLVQSSVGRGNFAGCKIDLGDGGAGDASLQRALVWRRSGGNIVPRILRISTEPGISMIKRIFNWCRMRRSKRRGGPPPLKDIIMEMIRREWPGIKPPSSAIGGRWKYIVVSMHPASDHAGIERTRSQIREGEWQFHSTEFRGGEDCWLLVVCSPEADLEITLLAECLDPVDSWLSARILDLYVRQSMPPLMLWRKGQGCGTVEPFDKLS